jgi:VWFA-related protein
VRQTHRILPLVFLLFASALVADQARIVAVDVAVTDKAGNPIAGLEQRHFKIFEDDLEQTIVGFGSPAKPLNAVLLVEFSDNFAAYEDVVEPTVGLIQALPPDSWIALVTFGIQPTIELDFTRDRNALTARVRRMQMPFSRETALYDALSFVLDRLAGLPGKNALFLLSRGHDTISKLGYSEAMKLAQSSDTAIYSIGLAEFARLEEIATDPGAEIARLQAANVMRSFAEASGGLLYVPRSSAEYKEMYQTIRADLTYQYRLAYVSSSQAASAKLRKFRIEVSAIDINSDGKPDKLKVRHKKGYYGQNARRLTDD